jgi:hypothetical protein
MICFFSDLTCSRHTTYCNVQEENGEDDLSGYSSTHYKSLRKFLKYASISTSHIEWFPGYGCVLILHRDAVQRQNSLNVTVLGLDSHHHVVHSGQNRYEFSAIAQTYVELFVGQIDVTKKEDFWRTFQTLFDKASSRKGDGRSASDGKQGHQKTPAFIHALLLQALKCPCVDVEMKMKTDVLPRGGFTDVGRHTGGEARDTAFALVRSLCMWTLERSFYQEEDQQKVMLDDLSHDAVLLHFHSFVLENAIRAVQEWAIGRAPDESNDLLLKFTSHLWGIMKVVGIAAARLCEEGRDLSAHFSKFKLHKAAIMKVQHRWYEGCVAKYTIELPLPSVSYHVPEIIIPPIANVQNSRKVSLAKTEHLIRENIGTVPTFCLDEYWTISSAHKWASEVFESASSSSNLSVYLHHIEKMLWKLSEKYLVEALNLKNLWKVVELLNFYRRSVEIFFARHANASPLHVRMRSIELLATWLVYCIVFNATRAAHPEVLNGYGVALHYQDLSHLVLQAEEHIIVLKKVVVFLGNNYFGEDKEIFSMRGSQDWNSATFQMGHLYSKLYLSAMLAKEKEDAEHRVNEHWLEVLSKKVLASILRNELPDLVRDLLEASNAYEEAQNLRPYREFRHAVSSARRSMNSAQLLVDEKNREIVEAEKAPPPVIQPLPANDDKALKILFFLYISEEFEILSRLSLVAQQLLVPKPWKAQCGGQDGIQEIDVFGPIKVAEKDLSWCQHYNAYEKCDYHSPHENRESFPHWLDISMHIDVPDSKDIGPHNVDLLFSSSDGIWHPDKNDVRLVWYGGPSVQDRHSTQGLFDPFKIPCSYTGRKHYVF